MQSIGKGCIHVGSCRLALANNILAETALSEQFCLTEIDLLFCRKKTVDVLQKQVTENLK